MSISKKATMTATLQPTPEKAAVKSWWRTSRKLPKEQLAGPAIELLKANAHLGNSEEVDRFTAIEEQVEPEQLKKWKKAFTQNVNRSILLLRADILSQ